MIKRHHPIPVARHLPHQLCFVFAQDFLIQQSPCNFLVLRRWKSKPFGQDVSADIKEGLKGSSQIRLGGSNVAPVPNKTLFVFLKEVRPARPSFPGSMRPAGL